MRAAVLSLSLCAWSACCIAAAPKPEPVSQLPIVERIAVPAGPGWLGVGFGSVWLSKSQEHAVYRIDPVSNKIVATIPVGPDPELGFGIGLGSVWVADTKEHSIRQIDPATNKVVNTFAANISNEPEGSIDAGAGSVWALTNEEHTDSGTLSRIDPNTGKVIANIKVKPHSYAVVLAQDSAWVTNSADASVTRVDVKTNRVTATIPVHAAPRFIAAGEGAIWVLSQSDGSLARIDPATNRVTATLALGGPGPGGDLWAEDGMVWASANRLPISMIDPQRNRLLRQFASGENIDTLRAAFGAVWVIDAAGGQVWKVSIDQLKRGR
jgi:virginiamycin B lyase